MIELMYFLPVFDVVTETLYPLPTAKCWGVNGSFTPIHVFSSIRTPNFPTCRTLMFSTDCGLSVVAAPILLPPLGDQYWSMHTVLPDANSISILSFQIDGRTLLPPVHPRPY